MLESVSKLNIDVQNVNNASTLRTLHLFNMLLSKYLGFLCLTSTLLVYQH